MSVMDPTAGAQPQSPAQTVPAGGAEPPRQPLDIDAAIDGLNDESEIRNLLFAEPSAQPEPASHAAPEPSGNEPGNGPPPADPQPDPATAGQTPPDEDPDLPADPPEPQAAPNLERISLKSLHPDDRLLIAKAKDMVRDGKAASFADAIMALNGAGTQEPSPQPPAGQTEQPDPQPDPEPPAQPARDVTAIQQLIADLRAQRQQAIQDYDRATETQLTSQIEDALAELAEAKAEARLAQRETMVQQQTLQSVVEDIYVAYPDSEDPTSFFSYRLTQELGAYEAAHGPIARHPHQLKALADKVAREIGTQARGHTQQQQTPAASVQPRQKAQPIGTAAPGSAAAVRVSPDQLQKAIETADEETLHAALFGDR